MKSGAARRLRKLKIKMESKKRILFIPEAVTYAHVGRLLALAGSLNPQNYEAVFASGPQYQRLIEKAGFKFYPIPTISSEEFLYCLDRIRFPYTYQELKEYVEAELGLFKELSPDLIVGDFRLSLGISCDCSGIPYANLVNAYWSPYYKKRFSLPDYPIKRILGEGFSEWLFSILKVYFLNQQTKHFNKLRRNYGLSAIGDLRYVYCYGTYTLYPDIPSLFPLEGFPPPCNHFYLGPILYQPDIALPSWWSELTQDKPLIYITMGSSGDDSLYEEILTAFQDLPAIACVATSGRIKIKDTAGRNIFWAEYLPGIELASRASLVICNGGAGSVYQALAFGVPILAFPRNMDQFLFMAQVQAQGAGLFIRKRNAVSTTIKKTIVNLLENSGFKANAVRLKEEAKNWDSLRRFNEFIIGILK